MDSISPFTTEAGFAGANNEPMFTPAQLEELGYRRFNPLDALTAASLTAALDAFNGGMPAAAAKLWRETAKRDETISTVKAKREEAVALRPWTVIPVDDSPEAADQAAALENFYRSITATHALNRHTSGGFPLLATQMMEAISYAFAVHHLIWSPNPGRLWSLPSGREVPTLTARAEYVPLEFFEARTGELRFLGMDQLYNGQPLAPGAWMVTAAEPGLMFAASIQHYYKRLATFDLVNFSEKFGTPGLVVHTTAAFGSPEAVAAEKLARSMAGNYRGVQYGALENKVEVVWPSGGTGGSNLPMTTIIEDAKRAIATLYLGGDLSTMSRGQGVGASVQDDEQVKREQADCARISETLNAALDPIVIRWYFGDAAPVLARVMIESPDSEDKKLLAELVALMVNQGAEVPVAPVMKRLNLPLAKKGEATFQRAVPPPAGPFGGAPASAINAAPAARPRGDGPVLGPLLANSFNLFGEATNQDLAPLRAAMKHVLGAEDDQLLHRASQLNDALPGLAPQIIAAIHSQPALEKILGSALAVGTAADPTKPLDTQPSHANA